jgi:hypothetical protein
MVVIICLRLTNGSELIKKGRAVVFAAGRVLSKHILYILNELCPKRSEYVSAVLLMAHTVVFKGRL